MLQDNQVFVCSECCAVYTVGCMSIVQDLCKPCFDEVESATGPDENERTASQYGLRVIYSDNWHAEGI